MNPEIRYGLNMILYKYGLKMILYKYDFVIK